MLNRVITNIYDDALRSLDLKVSQMSILVATAKVGTARPSEVCEHLQAARKAGMSQAGR
jgi:DNA-binding MarR family transcriptional regulator